MPFLLPNQQHQSTEGNNSIKALKAKCNINKKNGLRQYRDAKLLAVVVGSPHAEQVMINKRLGFESNLAEKVGDFGIAL